MKAPLRVRGTRHPVMYELDVRSWLARLTVRSGRRVKLGNIPRVEIESILSTGADLVWLMGVWRTGPAGRRVSRTKPGLADEAAAILPDFSPGDIVGSPYAVAAYEVADGLGGEHGLAALRQQLAERGVGIALDFVPNHTAMDHPWVRRHPDWYVQASLGGAESDPADWFAVRSDGRIVRLAHGRDPNYPAWPDTAQLDYRVPGLRAAMAEMLLQVASRCDGIRCDMRCSSSTTCSARRGGSVPGRRRTATLRRASSGGMRSSHSAIATRRRS